jgi:hypothetical protein
VVRRGLLAFALACLACPVAAQISPGPLAEAHRQLEGPLHCVKCHGGGNKAVMTALCLDCHKEIAWLVQRGRGFHAGVADQPCSTCHPEHAGRDFALIRWPDGDSARFDHARTRWPLDGGHAKVKCVDCHKAAFRISPAARLAERGVPARSWVGLEQQCAACHADVHRGRLGSACTKCHVTSSFKTINRVSFDHDRTHYPLRGRHIQVACEKCHQMSSGRVFSSPRFASCADCHQDAHAGTATLAGRVVDCAACHMVQDWQPSTFTVAQHRLAKYPLEGRHEPVKCAACHVKNPAAIPAAHLGSAGVWLRPVAAQCRDCHADDHGGQFASRPDRGACGACHTVGGWRPSTFTVAAHATLRLKLEGRHAQIECRACHGPDRAGLPPLAGAQVLGRAGVALTLKETECAACHIDPHDGRLPRCLDCHDTRRFRPSTIDIAAHRGYKFPLDGAHGAVPCIVCHQELQHPATTSSLLLARWSFSRLAFAAPAGGCAGCHASPHGQQFAARSDRGACEGCHDVAAFRPATRFDHERDAAFSLKGAHAHVPCSRCHVASGGSGGKPVVVYRPVSGKCETCHGDTIRRGS